jgi:hypothetical protein
MSKTPLILSIVAFAAVALAAFGYYKTRVADACGAGCDHGDTAVASTATSVAHEESDDHTCSLAPGDREDALTSFGAFSAEHLASVEASVTATFNGDKTAIGPYLTEAIEREASCCSFLKFEMEETAAGYRVTMSADGSGVNELTSALEMMTAR